MQKEQQMEFEFNLPKEIREQADLAEQVHAQLFPTDTPNYDEPVDDVVDEDEPKEEPKHADEEESWKKRYETLQGKYNAEVPQLAKELREFKETYINNQLEKLKPKEEVEEPTTDPLVSKFLEEYGDDFANQLRAFFRAEAEKVAQDAIKPLKEKVDYTAQEQENIARKEFTDYLDANAKGWDKLMDGSDPKFIEFLQKPDPSGLYTYGDLFNVYNDKWDREKLGTLFNLYLKPEGKQAEPAKPNPAKEAMVAPNRSSSNPSPNTQDKKIWSQEEISQFQQDDRKGKFTSEESKLLWDDLLAALNENRIR